MNKQEIYDLFENLRKICVDEFQSTENSMNEELDRYRQKLIFKIEEVLRDSKMIINHEMLSNIVNQNIMLLKNKNSNDLDNVLKKILALNNTIQDELISNPKQNDDQLRDIYMKAQSISNGFEVNQNFEYFSEALLHQLNRFNLNNNMEIAIFLKQMIYKYFEEMAMENSSKINKFILVNDKKLGDIFSYLTSKLNSDLSTTSVIQENHQEEIIENDDLLSFRII